MNRLIYSNWRPPSEPSRRERHFRLKSMKYKGIEKWTTKRGNEDTKKRESLSWLLWRKMKIREKSCLSLGGKKLSKGESHDCLLNIKIIILEGKEISLALAWPRNSREPNMVTIIQNGLITSVKYILSLVRPALRGLVMLRRYQSNNSAIN